MTHWTEETYVETPAVIEESMRRGLARADDDVADLLSLLETRGIEPERALDVACGIGRHAIEFAEAGLAVDGVDISPAYVEVARERAGDAGVSEDASFDVVDMRELDGVDGAYDVVLNWFAFGYFEDAVNEAVAEQFLELVGPSGALVMGVANAFECLEGFERTAASDEGDVLKVERREFDPGTGRLEARITKFRERADGYEFLGEVPFDTRLYAPVELRRLLERAGFSEVALYGGLDGAELELDSRPLVAVAEP